MAQLDPELRKLMVREEKEPGTLARLDQELRVFLKFTGELAPLEALGFHPLTVRGPIATGRLSSARLAAIVAHPNAVKLQLARTLRRELDKSITEINARGLRSVQPDGTWTGTATGRGVIVGVLDSGVNVAHQSFRNPDGTSRILAIWDQSSDEGPSPDEAFGITSTHDYGRVYDKDDIDGYLDPTSPESIPHRDRPRGHGTHVLGIAAGNGRQDDRCQDPYDFVGVAPEADIVVVKLRRRSDPSVPADEEDDFPDSLGEDSNLVDAITFVNEFAASRRPPQPVVINISQGDNLGPHDGTSLVEQLIDIEYAGATGKSLVKSAGNEGITRRHAADTVPAAGELDVEFTVRGDDDERRFVEIWYPGSDPLLGDLSISCSVRTPDGSTTDVITTGDLETFQPQGDTEVTITSDTNDVDNGDKRIRIELDPKDGKLPSGTWVAHLINTSPIDIAFHAWIERGEKAPHFEESSASMTLSIPGTARHAVVVANYRHRGDEAGEISSKSSRGPTRDSGRPPNQQKPDLAAPGTDVISARASEMPCCEAFWCCCRMRHHKENSGTSMSAPHVAGAIALMYQVHPGLTNAEVIDILRSTAVQDAETGAVPNARWGAGKLNVGAAVAEALSRAPAPAPAVDPPPAPGPVPAQPARVVQRRSPPPIVIDVDALMERLRSTDVGRGYVDLVERHIDEVVHLINHNKKVATIWHRNGGPMVVRAVMLSLAFPDEALPEIINGMSLADRLAPVAVILRRFGSDALVEDLNRHQAELLSVAGRTANGVLSDFERIPSAVARTTFEQRAQH